MPKGPDELGLQQAELVIVLQKEEGEALCRSPDLHAQSLSINKWKVIESVFCS